MDRQGIETVKKVFENSSIGEVEITPELEEEEDVRFVTIRPLDRTRPAMILNILDEAGLIYDVFEDTGDGEGPSLDPVLNDAFAITFEDKNLP